MEFVLFYRGSLPSNADAEQKHAIRQCFHQQLRELWKIEPYCRLTTLTDKSNDHPDNLCVMREHYCFVPLVSTKLNMIASISLTLLSPHQAGKILTNGGDIDNRLKTLFDALSVPQNNQMSQLPEPSDSENPFYCVLEDDKLITEVNVATAQVFDPQLKQTEAILFLRVAVKSIVKNYLFLS